MTGYGTNGSKDMYSVYNLKTCKITESHDVQWMGWIRKPISNKIDVFANFGQSSNMGGLNGISGMGVKLHFILINEDLDYVSQPRRGRC